MSYFAAAIKTAPPTHSLRHPRNHTHTATFTQTLLTVIARFFRAVFVLAEFWFLLCLILSVDTACLDGSLFAIRRFIPSGFRINIKE